MLVRIFFVIISSFVSFHCSKDCLEERLALGKSWFNAAEKKEVKLFIRNTSSEEVKLPEWLYQGLKDDSSSEIYLETMRKGENGTYSEIEKKNIDYDYLLEGRIMNTIKPGKEAEYKINLEMFYDLTTKGTYRVRATIKFKFIPNCPEVITSWQEFEVR